MSADKLEYQEKDVYAYLKQVRLIQHQNNLRFLKCDGTKGFEISPRDQPAVANSTNEIKTYKRNLYNARLRQSQAIFNYNELEKIQPHAPRSTLTDLQAKLLEKFIKPPEQELEPSISDQVTQNRLQMAEYSTMDKSIERAKGKLLASISEKMEENRGSIDPDIGIADIKAIDNLQILLDLESLDGQDFATRVEELCGDLQRPSFSTTQAVLPGYSKDSSLPPDPDVQTEEADRRISQIDGEISGISAKLRNSFDEDRRDFSTVGQLRHSKGNEYLGQSSIRLNNQGSSILSSLAQKQQERSGLIPQRSGPSSVSVLTDESKVASPVGKQMLDLLGAAKFVADNGLKTTNADAAKNINERRSQEVVSNSLLESISRAFDFIAKNATELTPDVFARFDEEAKLIVRITPPLIGSKLKDISSRLDSMRNMVSQSFGAAPKPVLSSSSASSSSASSSSSSSSSSSAVPVPISYGLKDTQIDKAIEKLQELQKLHHDDPDNPQIRDEYEKLYRFVGRLENTGAIDASNMETLGREMEEQEEKRQTGTIELGNLKSELDALIRTAESEYSEKRRPDAEAFDAWIKEADKRVADVSLSSKEKREFDALKVRCKEWIDKSAAAPLVFWVENLRTIHASDPYTAEGKESMGLIDVIESDGDQYIDDEKKGADLVTAASKTKFHEEIAKKRAEFTDISKSGVDQLLNELKDFEGKSTKLGDEELVNGYNHYYDKLGELRDRHLSGDEMKSVEQMIPVLKSVNELIDVRVDMYFENIKKAMDTIEGEHKEEEERKAFEEISNNASKLEKFTSLKKGGPEIQTELGKIEEFTKERAESNMRLEEERRQAELAENTRYIEEFNRDLHECKEPKDYMIVLGTIMEKIGPDRKVGGFTKKFSLQEIADVQKKGRADTSIAEARKILRKYLDDPPKISNSSSFHWTTSLKNLHKKSHSRIEIMREIDNAISPFEPSDKTQDDERIKAFTKKDKEWLNKRASKPSANSEAVKAAYNKFFTEKALTEMGIDPTNGDGLKLGSKRKMGDDSPETMDQKEQALRRYELLHGMMAEGNDSPEVVQEMRELTLFLAHHKLVKKASAKKLMEHLHKLQK